MDFFNLLRVVLVVLHLTQLQWAAGQNENIPYENVENICETCRCTQNITNAGTFNELDCTLRGFKHILARWPDNFINSTQKEEGENIIVGIFSENSIKLLQQLPPSNANLIFICQHCHITQIQAPAFMDVPNIIELHLAWNELKTDELRPDIFRGRYNSTGYESIALQILDLSHNGLQYLNRHLFEYTTNLIELNLSYNPFKKLDESTITAIGLAVTLKNLDLSFTGLKTLNSSLFEHLISLEVLNLAGNEFSNLPDKMYLIGHSLKYLNLADNYFEEFSEESFLGLKVLQQLNISSMPKLKMIKNNTFTRLETLTHLSCSYNPNLEKFHLDSLMHCQQLSYLDLSYCSLTELSLNINVPHLINSSTLYHNKSNALPRPWSKLKTFNIRGNLWLCDCYFAHLLDYIGTDLYEMDKNYIMCDSPRQFSGISLQNLTTTQICSMQAPKQYPIIDEGPPRFRRRRYIVLMLVTASIVVIFGITIGLAVVYIRRHLKRKDFGLEPIRYTSVRNSNLSTFS